MSELDVSLGRLCFLLTDSNRAYSDRNNCYQRCYRRSTKIRQSCRGGRLHFRSEEYAEKSKQDWIKYYQFDAKATAAYSEVKVEVRALCKTLGVKLKRMCNCPIVQRIRAKDFSVQHIDLNGKDIRRLAFEYHAEKALLEGV